MTGWHRFTGNDVVVFVGGQGSVSQADAVGHRGKDQRAGAPLLGIEGDQLAFEANGIADADRRVKAHTSAGKHAARQWQLGDDLVGPRQPVHTEIARRIGGAAMKHVPGRRQKIADGWISSPPKRRQRRPHRPRRDDVVANQGLADVRLQGNEVGHAR